MFKILSNEKLKEQYLKHYTNGFADGQKNELENTKAYKNGYEMVKTHLDSERLVNFSLQSENKDLRRENESISKSIDRYRKRNIDLKSKINEVHIEYTEEKKAVKQLIEKVSILESDNSRLIEEKEDMYKELERILGDKYYWMEESRKKEHHAYSKLCFNITLAKKYEWIAKKTKKARIREKAMKKLLEV